MPELPEVETIRRQLAPRLTGARIERAALFAPPGPKYAGLELAAGRHIGGVERRGKFLKLPLSARPNGAVKHELIVHLGMTGVLLPAEPEPSGVTPHGENGGRPLSGERHKHLRVRLELSDGALDFIDPRRFGRFLVVEAGDYRAVPLLARLGPEPLGAQFTPEGFAAALAASRMAIKAYLLGQRPVAGVGNIYADEVLWRAGVHPLTPASRVAPDAARLLHQAIRDVLTASIAAQGTTLNDYRTVYGESGDYMESLDVYGRAGSACRRCGSTLERLVVAQRGTTICPNCQAPPRR